MQNDFIQKRISKQDKLPHLSPGDSTHCPLRIIILKDNNQMYV